jgi:uncharacterized protein (DUF1330 family)
LPRNTEPSSCPPKGGKGAIAGQDDHPQSVTKAHVEPFGARADQCPLFAASVQISENPRMTKRAKIGNRLTLFNDLVVASKTRAARAGFFPTLAYAGRGQLTALFIGEIEVTEENRQDYESVFLAQAYKELEEAGAKLIAGGFDKTVSLVGIPPKNRYVVIQFESMKALENWWQGPAGAFVRENTKKYGGGVARYLAADGLQE